MVSLNRLNCLVIGNYAIFLWDKTYLAPKVGAAQIRKYQPIYHPLLNEKC